MTSTYYLIPYTYSGSTSNLNSSIVECSKGQTKPWIFPRDFLLFHHHHYQPWSSMISYDTSVYGYSMVWKFIFSSEAVLGFLEVSPHFPKKSYCERHIVCFSLCLTLAWTNPEIRKRIWWVYSFHCLYISKALVWVNKYNKHTCTLQRLVDATYEVCEITLYTHTMHEARVILFSRI